MKYIKLFEDFNEEPYIEYAKSIIISHLGEIEEEGEIDPSRNADNILLIDIPYTISEDEIKELDNDVNKIVSDEETSEKTPLLKCKEHLEAEGFFLFLTGKDWQEVKTNVTILVGVGNSFEEWINNWLNDNFGNLKRIEYGTTSFYTEDHSLTKIESNPSMATGHFDFIPRSVIFYLDTTNKSSFTKVNWEKLWQFLDHDLFLNRDQIREILKNWLEKTYGLKDIPPIDWANI